MSLERRVWIVFVRLGVSGGRLGEVVRNFC